MNAEDLRWMAERGHITLCPTVFHPDGGEPDQAVRVAHGPDCWIPLATIAAVIFPEAAQ